MLPRTILLFGFHIADQIATHFSWSRYTSRSRISGAVLVGRTSCLAHSWHSTLPSRIPDPSPSVELTVHRLDLPLRSLIVFNRSPMSLRFHLPRRTVASIRVSVRANSWCATRCITARVSLADESICWLGCGGGAAGNDSRVCRVTNRTVCSCHHRRDWLGRRNVGVVHGDHVEGEHHVDRQYIFGQTGSCTPPCNPVAGVEHLESLNDGDRDTFAELRC